MSRLWRSFPPVFLLLWLSKWLRKSRGLNLGVGDTTSHGPKKLRSISTRPESAPRTKPPKPLKGKSKPAPKVEDWIAYDGPITYIEMEGTDYKKRKLS